MKRAVLLNGAFDTAIPDLISWVGLASFCYQSTQTDEIFHIIQLFFSISQSSFFRLFIVGVECCCYIWSHSVTHTLGRTPLDEGSAGRRDFYLTTRNIHKRETSIYWRGICFSNLSKRAAANPRLRQGDQCDRPVSFICHTVYWGWFIDILITLVFPRSFPFYTFFQFQLVYE